MRYKNETNENIKVRTGNMSNCIWMTVRPGEEADLPWHIGDPSGMTRVNQEKHSKGADNDNQAKKDKPTPVALPNQKEYRQKLIAINGIGPKYAREIMQAYPTEDDLRDAVKKGIEIHRHDGVDESVKDIFG